MIRAVDLLMHAKSILQVARETMDIFSLLRLLRGGTRSITSLGNREMPQSSTDYWE